MCDCEGDIRSRVQVSRPKKGQSNSRTIKHWCAVGECYFCEEARDDNGEVITFSGESLDTKTAKAMGL